MNKKEFKGIWIPKEIWLNDKLTLQEKVFLVEIESLDNEKGCFAGNEYFAKFFGISKRRASDVINKLVKKKMITAKVFYKRGTKIVDKRVLKKASIGYRSNVPDPIEGSFHRVEKKPSRGMEETFHPPIEETFQDNNTSINNTVNNTINNTVNKEHTPFQKELIKSSVEVIEYFNELAGRKVSIKENSENVKYVLALRKKVGNFDDIKNMVMVKCWEWKGDAKMQKYLEPITIFKRHGKRYTEEAKEAKENPNYQEILKAAKKANGKKEDEGSNMLTIMQELEAKHKRREEYQKNNNL
tara:strand:+ start:256 stop:1149 length:894 start_codon:yes stop_codon:yes gene_type:complete